MLSKCANPNCSAPFLYLRSGKLFRWDGIEMTHHDSKAPAASVAKKTARKVEFFWLCGNCAPHMTVVFHEGHGITVRPLRRVHKEAS